MSLTGVGLLIYYEVSAPQRAYIKKFTKLRMFLNFCCNIHISTSLVEQKVFFKASILALRKIYVLNNSSFFYSFNPLIQYRLCWPIVYFFPCSVSLKYILIHFFFITLLLSTLNTVCKLALVSLVYYTSSWTHISRNLIAGTDVHEDILTIT